jgi:hypothetical protein
MSGRKKKGRQPLVPFAGSERRRPGEADRLVDASHDLGPFDEEDGGGRGLDPELVALQAVGLLCGSPRRSRAPSPHRWTRASGVDSPSA